MLRSHFDRRFVIAASVVLVTAACGSNHTSVVAGQPTTPISQPSHLTPTTTAAEAGASEDGTGLNCKLDHLVREAAAAVDATVLSISPSRTELNKTWQDTVVLQDYVLHVIQIRFSNGSLALTVGADVSAVNGFTETTDPGPNGTSPLFHIDYDPSMKALSQTFLVASYPTDHGDVPRLLTTFDGANFTGPCAGSFGSELRQQEVSSSLKGLDLLHDWTLDIAAGDNKYGDPHGTKAAAATKVAREQAWRKTDPATRSLQPVDVPDDVRTQLDVRGLDLQLAGLDPTEAVLIRTASGNSGSVVADALPTLYPAYFIPGNKEALEIDIVDRSTLKVKGTVTSISPADLAQFLGFKITGPATSASVLPMTREQLAADMGRTPEQLDALRTGLLATGTAPTSTTPSG